MGVVTVEIAGQRYPIRSGLDERYVTELAAYVDQKMRAAIECRPGQRHARPGRSSSRSTSPTMFFRARQQQSHRHGELNERALQLEQLVDDVLAQMTVKQAVNAS